MLSDIWLANSRVGEIINILGPLPLRFEVVKWFKMGNTNAAVLPVPVWAVAKICSFFMMCGMDFSWMAVGSLYPASWIALSISGARFRVLNDKKLSLSDVYEKIRPNSNL